MKALILASTGVRTAYVAGAAFVLLREQARKYDVLMGLGMGGTAAMYLHQGPDRGFQAAELLGVWTSMRNLEGGQMPFGPLADARGGFIGPGSWLPAFESLRPAKAHENGPLFIGGWSSWHHCYRQWDSINDDDGALWNGIKIAAGVMVSENELIEPSRPPVQTLIEFGVQQVDILFDRPLGAEREIAVRPEAFEIAFFNSGNKLAGMLEREVSVFRQSSRFRVLRPKDDLSVDPLCTDPFRVRSLIAMGQRDARERFQCP